MTKRYFVTGTDTGVGKTFVTATIARHATQRGQRVFAFKPIETGIVPGQPSTEATDQELLTAAAGGWQTGDLAGAYRFELPAAPRVAAAAEGATIDLGRIDRALIQGSAGVDLVLVEGAGGWRVPLTDELDMGGFALRLGFPVIVVARAGLGTINHSLLTVEAVERDGCQVAALVLSMRPEESRPFVDSNVEEISRAWPGRILVLEGPSSLEPLL